MCSICGGSNWDPLSHFIWEQAKDRGRDYHGLYTSPKNNSWVGNHRATPTTEVEKPTENQPVGVSYKLVFNGIIANDKELGVLPGEVDTSILPRILNISSLGAFRDSFKKIVGSYAIGILFPNGEIWLACNYKPIWWIKYQDNYYFSSLASHFPTETQPIRMKPYSVLNLKTGESLPIDRNQSERALVICSSGLDSVTVASIAKLNHGDITLLHFDYGCRAGNNEMEAIKNIAHYFNCKFKIIPMPSFGGSSLLDDTSVLAKGESGAEYAHEWVPARNLVMLSIATAYAEANNIGHIYLGTNLEESGAYPDNEEQFILDFNNLLYSAVQNGTKIEIHSPLGGLMKHEIVKLGIELNTPYHLTWSCYENKEYHCGECGPCFMRKTAFKRNGLIDPVKYLK